MLMSMPGNRDRRLRQWHAAGLSQRRIAERLEVSQHWVYLRLRQLGLPAHSVGCEASRRWRSETMRLWWRIRRERQARREAWAC